MKAKSLIYNARILSQAEGVVADSMAWSKGRIVAVGRNLHKDPEFRAFDHIDLKGRAVVPGFIDSHAHFAYFASSFGRVSLHGLTSLEACLNKIEKHAAGLKRSEWVQGEGYAPDSFKVREEPDRYMLDEICGGRPALIASKDEHSICVNSLALRMAGINQKTRQPAGGEIQIDEFGEPTGILREQPAAERVHRLIPSTDEKTFKRYYKKALHEAYRVGITGVHSVDGPDGFEWFGARAEDGTLGLRIDYYAPAAMLPQLKRAGASYGLGNNLLRICGVKLFADGSLGSQSAYCFNKYIGSGDKYGIPVMSRCAMLKLVRTAARLGLPSAVHAIGDRAVSNVLDVFEQAPQIKSGGRHRIEHLQLIRRKDVKRVRRLGVIASMQPSHCPADIKMVRAYWGARGRNAYIFRTLIDAGVDVIFGSDCPIEPLDPLGGIHAAVRRAFPGSRDVFYPEQRITAAEALYRFTALPAMATGRGFEQGRLLPGYYADFVVLSDDPTRVSPTRISEIEVLATFFDGKVKYRVTGSGL